MRKYFRILSFTVLLIFVMQLVIIALPAFAAEETINQSKQLKTKGNKIVFADDESVEVRLIGLNIFDYIEKYNNVERSTMEAYDNWHSNIIRLHITLKEWSNDAYKKNIARIVKMASDRGKYVILDSHQYKSFRQEQLDFWKEVAQLYKNNPAVLFGILNEPHSITWEQWRNGGGDMVTEGGKTFVPIGHQTVVEMIRDLGAKNIIVAGGLDWGYDLRGIVGEAEGDPKVYALEDQGSNNNKSKAGNGIIYDTHIYPWKGLTADWDKMMGTARKLYPVISGENGWDAGTIMAIIKTEYEPDTEMYYTNWNPEFFEFVNDVETYGSYLNWTGWCFHPISSPRILANRDDWNLYDYSYQPTDYWGIDVQNEMNKMFGKNLITGKTIVNSSDSNFAKLATDGDYDTVWKYEGDGEKFIEIDLGSEYIINQWAIRHSGSKSYKSSEQLKNTVDFKILSSLDGVNWKEVDSVIGNQAPVTERIVKDFNAKFIRFEFSKASRVDDVLRIHDLFVTGSKPEIKIEEIKVQTQASAEDSKIQDATITIPVSSQSEGTKKVTVVFAVFKNDGILNRLFEVKKITKEVKASSDITLTEMIPNDNNHTVTLLVYEESDNMEDMKAFEMNTIQNN